MFSIARTYRAESGRSKIPADKTTAPTMIGHLARSKSSRWGIFPVPLTASAAARSVTSVTAAYRRIILSVFQPPSAITIGGVKPRLSAIVALPCGIAQNYRARFSLRLGQ
jgi:hypothetical protein